MTDRSIQQAFPNARKDITASLLFSECEVESLKANLKNPDIHQGHPQNHGWTLAQSIDNLNLVLVEFDNYNEN